MIPVSPVPYPTCLCRVVPVGILTPLVPVKSTYDPAVVSNAFILLIASPFVESISAALVAPV